MAKSGRQQIIDSLIEKRIEYSEIIWEPISKGSIMSGYDGGWEVWLDVDGRGFSGLYLLRGYNYRQIIEQIESLHETNRSY